MEIGEARALKFIDCLWSVIPAKCRWAQSVDQLRVEHKWCGCKNGGFRQLSVLGGINQAYSRSDRVFEYKSCQKIKLVIFNDFNNW